VTEPNWAGGWRPAGYRPLPPVHPRGHRIQRGQRSRGQRAALYVLRVTLDGLARVLLMFMRVSFQLVAVGLRLLTPGIGSAKIARKAGRVG
jgi:hypothetical protein